jgi:hypothetical protein
MFMQCLFAGCPVQIVKLVADGSDAFALLTIQFKSKVTGKESSAWVVNRWGGKQSKK